MKFWQRFDCCYNDLIYQKSWNWDITCLIKVNYCLGFCSLHAIIYKRHLMNTTSQKDILSDQKKKKKGISYEHHFTKVLKRLLLSTTSRENINLNWLTREFRSRYSKRSCYLLVLKSGSYRIRGLYGQVEGIFSTQSTVVG